MIGTLQFEKRNGLLVPTNAERSQYQPPLDVSDLTRAVERDYQTGLDILNRPFREYNDCSVLEEMNENQRAFLMYPETDFINPDESWRWSGVRPTVRNKVLSLAAHLTAQILIPGIFAQNPQDEEDRQMAEVMRLRLEWHIRNSDYDITFLYGVIAGLVNPVAYLSVETVEAMQKIKKRLDDGSIEVSEAVDDVISGLRVENVPLDEVFITNPYEYNIQRQRAIGRRKYVEYSELEKIYGEHENWKFVTPGIKTIYSEEDAAFYDQRDEQLDTLAELFVYENRGEDLCVPYVNGIYLGDADVMANPIKHRDQENRPKYGLVKFGSEPIDEKRFYFYKSIASKLMQDHKLANRTWRIAIDTATYNMKPAIGISGDDRLDTDIYFPGASVSMGKDTKYQQLPSGNAAEGYNLIQLADQNMNESSQDPIRQGISSAGSQTAFEVAKIEQNARVQLGLIGKMLVRMVKDVGTLMVEDVVRHDTVGEVMEMLPNAEARMKFLKFSVPNKTEGGKTLTKEVRFDDSIMGMEMDEDEMMEKQQALFEEEGGDEGNKRIMLVNPNLFRKMKFMVTMDVEDLMPKNEAFESALLLDAYAKAITNPLVQSDAEAMANVTRDLLFGAMRVTRGNEDKYLPKRPVLPMASPQTPPEGLPEEAVRGNPAIMAEMR